jgi:radical SAM superfamily enzyme YgiQ (UPF0313 family)
MDIRPLTSPDSLLRPGELIGLRDRLRRLSAGQDIASVIVCAFDHRTRMLPFIYFDTRMVSAGVRAIGSAMADCGLTNTRIVLQQWNPRALPSEMRLDGRVPDLLLISSMQIHADSCRALIADACKIPPAQRPLILVGGPKAIHQPWDLFSGDPANPISADVAITGEEFVLLSLLEVLLTLRSPGEPLRRAFERARDQSVLDSVGGLMYARTRAAGQAEELIDTGPQRLLMDLDELPDPVAGFKLLEPPSRSRGLARQPLPADRVRTCSPIGAVVLTLGCKFNCPYCPIPEYNQRQLRFKSPGRIAEEFSRLHTAFGLRYFFGADDNFLNDQARALRITEELARKQVGDRPLRRVIRWGTEATIHDTLAMGPDLAALHKGGLRALWLGVEDMSGALVRKGQGSDATLAAFALLRRHGIMPMAMLMHHDDQPLYSRGNYRGLLNQVNVLRQAGAVGMQVMMITPAPGSKLYAQNYASGMVLDSAGGKKIEPRMFDANYVVASRHPRPWRNQANLLAAYLWFYNPIRWLVSLVAPKTRLYLADAGMQTLGMLGLVQTARRTIPWLIRLAFGKITRRTQPPASPMPIRCIHPECPAKSRELRR